MNYEQKYKEALDAARHIYDDMKSGGNFGGMEDLEVIFPELAESEDERIRQELIYWINTEIQQCSIKEHADKLKSFVAWLEKQKEQKDFPITDEEVKELLGNTPPVEVPEKYKTPDWLFEKQKEQKPINESNMHEPTLDEARKWNEAYEKGYSLGYENGRNEQKPAECINIEQLAEHIKAEFESFRNLLKKKGIDYQPAEVYWTDFARLFVSSTKKLQKPVEKQDYSGLNGLERAILRGFLAAGVENVPVEIIKKTAQESLAQIKPAEWSEEDSKRYVSIRTTLETSAVLSKEDYDANVVWLRDLVNAKKYSGPKPSWKPSEEQIRALLNAEKYLNAGLQYGSARRIAELIEQLEKLGVKEEQENYQHFDPDC